MKTGIKTTIIIISVVILVALSIALPILLSKEEDKEDTEITENAVNQFIMHRGGRGYPENSAAAFENAITSDCYGIETDIWRTADGYFVCTHDRSVYFSGVGSVDIDNENYEILKDYNLQSSGKPLVLLDEYLRICKKGNKVAVIEIKDALNSADAEALFEVIDKNYSREKVCIISFKKYNLYLCRAIDSTVDYYLLGLTTSVFAQAIPENYNVGLFGGTITEELIKKAHDAGLKVMFGTTNDRDYAKTVLNMGVDLVTTDTYF